MLGYTLDLTDSITEEVSDLCMESMRILPVASCCTARNPRSCCRPTCPQLILAPKSLRRVRKQQLLQAENRLFADAGGFQIVLDVAILLCNVRVDAADHVGWTHSELLC